jgi:hypothetical protein
MADPDSAFRNLIDTSSTGAGLDFACNLLATAIGRLADTMPESAPGVLRTLAEYISFCYAGENGLAFEYLVSLATQLGDNAEFQRDQFWQQVKWLANAMSIPVNDSQDGGLPS